MPELSPSPISATRPPRTEAVAGLVLRLLGVVHLVAFASLWRQIDGLVSSRGILPVSTWLDRLDATFGSRRVFEAPTLLWISSSDAALDLLCAIGVALSIVLVLGLATRPVLLGLWLSYLSLVWGGQTFLQFQWDSLLLEATITALFLAPWAWHPGRGAAARPSPRTGILLLRLLLLKLMVLSGAVKLLSLDPTWLDLSALELHYQTQPLPHALSWYAHHLPSWFQHLSAAMMFGVELVAPFFMFGPRRLRLLGFGLLVALQVLIMATGNYGFFNLLTIVLCCSLLDDRALPRFVRRGRHDRGGEQAPQWRRRVRWMLAVALLVASALVSVREASRTVPRHRLAPGVGASLLAWTDELVLTPARPLLDRLDPFRSINGYGLFRAMTTSRPEIVIEASWDGDVWHELRFRYKPVELDRRPRWAGMYMPRLDWQMWFAALAPSRAFWLDGLIQRLFAGEPAVWLLLEPEQPVSVPPRYLRLVLFEYRFSTSAERSRTGRWWRREKLGSLTPALRRE